MALVDSDYSSMMTAWDRLTSGDAPLVQNAPVTTTVSNPATVQDGALHVFSVDLHPKQNAVEHHTKRYELVHLPEPKAVLRRGEPFTISITFKDRAFNLEKDNVRLIFDFGSNPIAIKGTKGIITVTETADDCWPDLSGLWDCRLQTTSDKNPLTIQVRCPADVPVGTWMMHVETSLKNDDKGTPRVHSHPDPIYILFNPWLKEDLVYMEDKTLLDEYVLNDVGKIWVGPHRSCRGRQWVFGQFDKNVLPSTMLMLERANLVPINRGNPIILSRAISKMVNSEDDQGILQGRWSGDYKGGTAPGAWTGSVEIMKAYLRTGRHVSFGQCWVFAGVTTTVCRALGLPSRVVSNLVSAHDANASFTIDKYYSKTGEELSFDPNNPEGEDSVWNFHVWNEAWMARPDLPKGYGGWQAIDATPQETSDGTFQCGPSSLEAIKRGMVGYKYDVPFLLSSVNADLIRWQEDPTSSLGFRKMDTNTSHIGRMLITKQPFKFDPIGDTDMENITQHYKDIEGTKMERTAMYNAVRGSTNARKFFFQPGESEEADLTFALEDLDRIPIGDNFTIVVTIKNNLNKARTLDVSLSANSVYYNGINAHLVKKASGIFQIKANSREQLRLVVTPDDYLDKLVEYCIMKIYVVITVPDTKQTWADEDDFQVTKPKLDIKVPDTPTVVGKPSEFEFTFKNPLNRVLKKCKLRYEGPGLSKPIVVDCKDVGPLEDVVLKGSLSPIRSGKHPLIGVFSSRELIDITGAATVEVVKAT